MRRHDHSIISSMRGERAGTGIPETTQRHLVEPAPVQFIAPTLESPRPPEVAWWTPARPRAFDTPYPAHLRQRCASRATP